MSHPGHSTPTWKNWLLLAVGLWAFLVPSWALVPGQTDCGAKNRTWGIFAQSTILRLASPLANAALTLGKVACSYENRVDPNCCGERWDQDLGLYYNRARYLNTDSGRFWNQDSYEGERREPTSLHKYLYASANPVSGFDPSGYFTLFEITLVQIIDGIKNTISVPVGAYARRKGVKTLTCVVGVSAAERWLDYEFSVEGHHPIPKSHGGAEDQVLLFLPESTHRAFHFIYNVFLKGDKEFAALGLHNSSPAADWEEAFKRNPALKKSALALLKKAARVIDKKCSLPKAFGLETYIKKNERRWLRGG